MDAETPLGIFRLVAAVYMPSVTSIESVRRSSSTVAWYEAFTLDNLP